MRATNPSIYILLEKYIDDVYFYIKHQYSESIRSIRNKRKRLTTVRLKIINDSFQQHVKAVEVRFYNKETRHVIVMEMREPGNSIFPVLTCVA